MIKMSKCKNVENIKMPKNTLEEQQKKIYCCNIVMQNILKFTNRAIIEKN